MPWDNTLGPFSKDPLVEQEFIKLRDKFNIECAIETGTMTGVTTNWLSKHFKEVYTIELFQHHHERAKRDCSPYTNINFLLGDSTTLLRNLLPVITDKKCIFFLDAHCGEPCPTPSELVVLKNMKVKPVIVIHDFLVPGKNFGYDTYASFVYKWENISQLIDDIYDKKYNYYYNQETAPGSDNRGVVYIEPILD